MTGVHLRRRRLVMGLLAGAGAFGLHTAAHAHAAMVKSEPARRAVLRKAPKQLRLWFNERLEPAYASIVLSRGDTQAVATGKAQVDAGDPKLLVLDLPPLEPGAYTVRYRVLSVDGHTVVYGYTFSIAPPGGTTGGTK